jgi:predicted phage terminase large subunit-like protein
MMKLPLKKILRDTAGTFDVETVNGRVIIEAYGKGAALRGLLHGTMRPTTVIIDDLQSYEDSLSETTQEKDWEWFLSDVKPLGKDVRIFMIGNNLGRRCVMERVMDLAGDLNFETMRIPIIENELSSWPERFPMDWIEKDKDGYRKAGKLGLWYRERMCQSYDDESRDFTQKMFRYYEALSPYKRICTGVDPAISKAERADFTAIVTAGIRQNNHIDVLDIVRRKMLPDETIDEIFRVQKKWGSTVGIEDVQFQRMLILEVQKQMAIRNSFFPLSSIKAMGQKEARIREILQPRYAAGTVWHSNSMGILESELIEFPTGLHDDVADALGIAVRMLAPMGKETGKLSYLYQSSQEKSDLDELFMATPRNPLRPIYGRK